MNAAIIPIGDVFRGIIRRGVAVRTDDGRFGFVRDPDFAFDAAGRIYLAGYRIQLTEGRGALFKAPEKVMPVTVTRAHVGRAALSPVNSKPNGVA